MRPVLAGGRRSSMRSAGGGTEREREQRECAAGRGEGEQRDGVAAGGVGEDAGERGAEHATDLAGGEEETTGRAHERGADARGN